jgi:hypothetical protein
MTQNNEPPSSSEESKTELPAGMTERVPPYQSASWPRDSTFKMYAEYVWKLTDEKYQPPKGCRFGFHDMKIGCPVCREWTRTVPRSAANKDKANQPVGGNGSTMPHDEIVTVAKQTLEKKERKDDDDG